MIGRAVQGRNARGVQGRNDRAAALKRVALHDWAAVRERERERDRERQRKREKERERSDGCVHGWAPVRVLCRMRLQAAL